VWQDFPSRAEQQGACQSAKEIKYASAVETQGRFTSETHRQMTTVEAVEVSFNSFESHDESANTMLGEVLRGSQRLKRSRASEPVVILLLILAKGSSPKKYSCREISF
jgi:hypothetical protein